MSVTDVALKQILMNEAVMMYYMMATDPFRTSRTSDPITNEHAYEALIKHTELTNEVLALFAKKKEQL